MKNYRIFVGILALALVFGFAACEGPVGPAGAGTPGVGTPGTSYLTGSQATEVIQYAIDAGGPLVLAGVTQSDADSIVIPVGRGVRILGNFTVHNTGTLVIADASSVVLTEAGTINSAGGTPAVIAPQAILDSNVGGNTTPVPIQTGAAAIDTTGTYVAVKGNITISTAVTSATNIINSTSGKNLFILGTLAVNNDITTTSINVLGSVSASGEIIGALNATGAVTFTGAQTALAGLSAASVTSTKAVSSSGDVGIEGNLTLTGLTTDGALTTTSGAKIEVGGSLSAASVTLGTATADALKVGGTTAIGTLTTSAANQITFGAAASVGTFAIDHAAEVLGTGNVTIGTGGATLVPSGVAFKVGAGTFTNGAAAVTFPSGTVF
jgi:filamentous hemagglutinin